MRKSIELKTAESSKYVLVESLRTTKKIYVNLKKLIRSLKLKNEGYRDILKLKKKTLKLFQMKETNCNLKQTDTRKIL